MLDPRIKAQLGDSEQSEQEEMPAIAPMTKDIDGNDSGEKGTAARQ